MTLTTKIGLSLAAQQSAALDLGTAQFTTSRLYGLALNDGTGVGQADKLFTDTRTLAASATEDLDLNGVLVDALGATLGMIRVKALIVAAAVANTNDVLVGGAASNGFITWVGGATHQVRLKPGAFMALGTAATDAVGWVVTPATGDLLRVGNGGGTTSVNYDIIVVGSSA